LHKADEFGSEVVRTEMVCSDCETTWYSGVAELIVTRSLISRCARCGGKLIAPEARVSTDHGRNAGQPPQASGV
jgi:DNA-directed RNA polymerase subunit RPC12/RpoP